MMDVDFIRSVCRKFPHTTENVQWGYDLVFKIGGKMYAVTPLEPHRVRLSFKASPEDFADLTERPGIIPAPYMARAQWVALESDDALNAAELKRYLRQSYDLVFAKLTKKLQAQLSEAPLVAQSPSRKPASKSAPKPRAPRVR
jgi:predicted DNA-binding protein (MmcQ/YjbR family)